MALITPTTQEINESIIAQLQATLNQTIPLLPRSFLRVLAKTLAGVFILLYKYTGFMLLQVFVQSAAFADTEINGVILSPLKTWGRLVGIGDPALATPAELLVDINVTTLFGSIPSGTALVGAVNGIVYITIGPIPLTASVVQGTIRAASDQTGGNGAGAQGNLIVGDIVSFVSPLANVGRNTVVALVLATGADGETEDAYRGRVLSHFQNRPQGGALADYKIWGEEPAGILRIYPYTSDCPGQIDIFVEATTAADVDGFPTPAQLQEVDDSIEFDPVTGVPDRRPANALVTVFSITRRIFDVTVTGLVTANPPQTQEDIIAQLTTYFLSREPFIAGLTVTPRADRIVASVVAGEVEDVVSAAQGIFNQALTFEGGTPVALTSLGIGVKAKLGTVTFA